MRGLVCQICQIWGGAFFVLNSVTRCAEKNASLILNRFMQLNPDPLRRPSLEFQLKSLKTKRVIAGQMCVCTHVFKWSLAPLNKSKLCWASYRVMRKKLSNLNLTNKPPPIVAMTQVAHMTVLRLVSNVRVSLTSHASITKTLREQC